MSQIVKSAKGQTVDFDLLKIKQQIATAPKPTQVQAREDFIDRKLKRRIKKAKITAAAEDITADVSAVSSEDNQQDN